MIQHQLVILVGRTSLTDVGQRFRPAKQGSFPLAASEHVHGAVRVQVARELQDQVARAAEAREPERLAVAETGQNEIISFCPRAQE